MATVTLNMSDRNPVTLDLAAGWSLQSTSTMETNDGTITVYLYVSALPALCVAGNIASSRRGATKYAGYVSTDANCLTTVNTEIETVLSELLVPLTAETAMLQEIRNSLDASTIAGA